MRPSEFLFAHIVIQNLAAAFPQNGETVKRWSFSLMLSVSCLFHLDLKRSETAETARATGRLGDGRHAAPLSSVIADGYGSKGVSASSTPCFSESLNGFPRRVSLLVKKPKSRAARTARYAADLPMPVAVPICSLEMTTSDPGPPAPLRCKLPLRRLCSCSRCDQLPA